MSSSNFPACLAVTLKYEGGNADNPHDPGGRTSRGVTQRTYDAYRRKHGLATRDVFLITGMEVDDVYRTMYWTPCGANSLPAGFDLVHFDGTVNSGEGNSARWLKIAKASSATDDAIHAYSKARLGSLHSFGAWATFGKGWTARVVGVEAKALVMAAAVPEIAKATIANAGAKAAGTAKTASGIAHGATLAAGAAIAVVPSHPALGVVSGLLAGLGAVWAAFRASTSGARAAVLSEAAAGI